MVKLMGLAMPSQDVNIKLTDLAMPPMPIFRSITTHFIELTSEPIDKFILDSQTMKSNLNFPN